MGEGVGEGLGAGEGVREGVGRKRGWRNGIGQQQLRWTRISLANNNCVEQQFRWPTTIALNNSCVGEWQMNLPSQGWNLPSHALNLWGQIWGLRGSERSDFRPERADFRPEKANSRPVRVDFRPEWVDYGPERAGFRPDRAWGDKQTNKQTNERTNKNPLCSTGLHSLRGRCPNRVRTDGQTDGWTDKAENWVACTRLKKDHKNRGMEMELWNYCHDEKCKMEILFCDKHRFLYMRIESFEKSLLKYSLSKALLTIKSSFVQRFTKCDVMWRNITDIMKPNRVR